MLFAVRPPTFFGSTRAAANGKLGTIKNRVVRCLQSRLCDRDVLMFVQALMVPVLHERRIVASTGVFYTMPPRMMVLCSLGGG